jgi:hypothetical protein
MYDGALAGKVLEVENNLRSKTIQMFEVESKILPFIYWTWASRSLNTYTPDILESLDY